MVTEAAVSNVVDEASKERRRRADRRDKLVAAKALHAAPDGSDLYDGDGIVIRVRNAKAYGVFRYTSPVNGKRREKGLGELRRSSLQSAGGSLPEVRAVAESARAELRKGVDPLDAEAERKRLRRAAESVKKSELERERRTLIAVARQYHEAVVEKSGRRSTRRNGSRASKAIFPPD